MELNAFLELIKEAWDGRMAAFALTRDPERWNEAMCLK